MVIRHPSSFGIRCGPAVTPRRGSRGGRSNLRIDVSRHFAFIVREQVEMRVRAGGTWQDLDLVFSTQVGTELDAANGRRAFRRVVAAAGLDPRTWTPRELRLSFVSLLSNSGVPIEDISHLVGDSSTVVTEKVYRKELRPVLTRGARAMNELFEGRRA